MTGSDPKRHVAFYIRVSTERQAKVEEGSLKNQEQMLRAELERRKIPIVRSVLDPLLQLQEESVRIAESELVFCYEDGLRLGVTWWKKRFTKAMNKCLS